MQYLITFPNLFELKRFVDHPIFSKWIRRQGTIHSGRFITINTPVKNTIIFQQFLTKFPTARVVIKQPSKSGFKYTTLQKGDF